MQCMPRSVLFLILALSFLACNASAAADPTSTPIEGSLPRETLARYEDDFRLLREDLWEKSDGEDGFFLAQMENFKLADMNAGDGGLVLQTQPGSFSSAGVVSRFAFQGDFDIQIDCRVDPLKGADDMDQIVLFRVMDATPGFREGETEFVTMGVSKERGKPAGLFTTFLRKGVYKLGKWKQTDRFTGSFRFIKTGSWLDALYRNDGETVWTPFDSLEFDKAVAVIALNARNSTARLMGSSRPASAFTARFGKFRVNAAREILGPEKYQSSTAELASLRIRNSLPEEKLARYHNDFRKFKEDLWEKGGGFFQEQTENFRLADTRVQDGRLVVETRTGAFSSGGIGSRFSFKGDFDVQVDCRVEFVKGAEDMDQIVVLGVGDPSEGLKQEELVNVSIGPARSRGKNAGLSATSLMKGEFKGIRWKGIDRFRGSLRLIKLGRTLYAFYRNEGNATWKSFGSFPFDTRATGVGLGVRNFEMRKGNPIGAKSPFSASFSNFRVNAAQVVVESEI